MIPYLAHLLSTHVWGPFRIFESYLVLLGLGTLLGAGLTWFLLPKLWHILPKDRGKQLTPDGKLAAGKPTGAGLIVVTIAVFVIAFVMPLSWRLLGVLACLVAVMLTGYLDDAAQNPWSEARKGALDVVISLATAACFSEFGSVRVWIPFIKGEPYMPSWLFIILAGFLLFVCINAVNCSDGVDGLAGSLSIMTLLEIGTFLYVIIGHNRIAHYFNVPHYGSGAQWAIMMFVSAGVFAGYLWYNAFPSQILMGDAGSRFLGLLIGIGALASGNMFAFLIVAPILIINGGSGLCKLIILRICKRLGMDVRPPLKKYQNVQNPKNFATDQEFAHEFWLVRLLHNVRFPLHDHCKKELNWSPTQVVIRFVILQAFITPILFILLIKFR